MPKSEWCEKQQVDYVGWIKGFYRAPKHIRCPDCNKRLKPLVVDCEDMFHEGITDIPRDKLQEHKRCIHVYAPRHKRK